MSEISYLVTSYKGYKPSPGNIQIQYVGTDRLDTEKAAKWALDHEWEQVDVQIWKDGRHLYTRTRTTNTLWEITWVNKDKEVECELWG